MDPQQLLRLAVEARIEAWDHPSIDQIGEAAGEVALMLQTVVRDRLPEALPEYTSLDGLEEFTARLEGATRLYILGAFYLLADSQDSMLPVEAHLDVASGSHSVIRVGSEATVFPMPTVARQFARRMQNVEWQHELELNLVDAA